LNSFDELYKEINKKYEIKICAFCKNSCWNPYGGTDFCNHLCFKIFSNEYYKINNRSKMEIVKLMEKYTGKHENVYLINSCEEYMEK
jgi:hypothetical protein